MQRIAIVGAAGHGGVVLDIVEKAGQYAMAGWLDKQPKGAAFLGYPMLGSEMDLPRLAHDLDGVIVAIGDNWIRHQVWQKIRDIMDDRLPMLPAIHPSAQIARDVTVGPGTVFMAGVVVNTGSKVGAGCILNTNSSLDHDSILEDFSSLAPGVTTGGEVRVGKCSAISLGANIIHGIRIGEHTVVGAGATVLQDVPDYVVAYGTPARVVRARGVGDKYL